MTPVKERVRLHRQRKAAIVHLQESPATNTLWKALLLFQSYRFQTAKGLTFTYRIKGNEMFVDRKEKSITRATVELAFQKVQAMDGIVVGPKKLGCFGASYLSPIFIRLEVVRTRGQE